MVANSSIPPAVDEALEVWLRYHDQLAPDLIEGLYLVGSVVLDDWQSDSDIDIVAFTADVPASDVPGSGDAADNGHISDNDGVAAMRAAHDATNAELGEAKIDGPRLLWGDVTRAPVQILRPWTLDGEFRHDDECFEINPVIWHTLAAYGISVRGPEPTELGIQTDPDALRSFVQSNTDSYWRGIAQAVGAAAQDPEQTNFNSAMTAWCVLGVARMLFTIRTGDIASKSAAGTWLAGELPEHGELVEHALSVRRGEVSEPDTRETTKATAAYLDQVVELVMASAEL